MKSDKKVELDKLLLKSDLEYDESHYARYLDAKKITEHYGEYENSIAVLSNLSLDCSYIYYGSEHRAEEVESIWEKQLLDQVHPDDVPEKHAWELRFVTFMESVPEEERHFYHMQHILRMKQPSGEYAYLLHRVMYLDFDSKGNVLLALCLYNRFGSRVNPYVGIIDTRTGEPVEQLDAQISGLLSDREKEVLQMIGEGLASKMIAGKLCISANTVNAHRQNILKKLQVSNSSEAFSVAKRLGIL